MKVMMKRALGATLVLLPFASLFAVAASDKGTPFAVMVFALTYAVVVAVSFGVWLLTE